MYYYFFFELRGAKEHVEIYVKQFHVFRKSPIPPHPNRHTISDFFETWVNNAREDQPLS